MSWSDRRLSYSACGALLILALAWPGFADEPDRLTDDGRLKASPMFFNDGADLIFAVLEDPTKYRLMHLQMADRSVRPLRKDASTAEFEPACSRDGRYCAFVHQRGLLSMSVAILDRHSDTLAEVVPPPGFAGMRSPALSPDSARVLYSFADGGHQQIYSTNVRADEPKKLTDSSGINNWPCFSPDGKQIAFGSTRDGNFEIYLMASDGTDIRRLTHNPMQDIRPRFSPDGKRIAFASHRDGNSEIYLVNADGTGLNRVTHHPERDDYPDWHVDGKRLVIVSEKNGQHDLYLVNVPSM